MKLHPKKECRFGFGKKMGEGGRDLSVSELVGGGREENRIEQHTRRIRNAKRRRRTMYGCVQ
jgi:hypothetical protein